MFSKIKSWYKRRQFNKLCIRIMGTSTGINLLEDLITWYDEVLDYVDIKSLYHIRIETELANVAALHDALEIASFNLTNERTRNYKLIDKDAILLDDWFVNHESYRVTLEESLSYSRGDLKAILNYLVTVHKSEVDFHLEPYIPILVTLRNLVRICYK